MSPFARTPIPLPQKVTTESTSLLPDVSLDPLDTFFTHSLRESSMSGLRFQLGPARHLTNS